jgi:hypothetical protein
LVYDPRQSRPVWFDVTSAKVDDVVAGRTIPLEPGAPDVFDKGYTDYRWWSGILAAGAVFVTRRKYNAHCRLVAEHAATGDNILADRLIKIGHRQARGGAPLNPLYEVSLREIVVARPDHDDLQRLAVEITQLYKERWDIELLFKWLKQNLKIRSFLGRSQNAVRIQIYVALIAFMWLRIPSHRGPRLQRQHRVAAHTHQIRLVQCIQPLSKQNQASQTTRLAAGKPATSLRFPVKPIGSKIPDSSGPSPGRRGRR